MLAPADSYRLTRTPIRRYILLMNPLKNFIMDRIRKIEDSLIPMLEEQAKINAKITTAQAELEDLRNAAKAIGIVKGLPTASRPITRRTQPEVTIKEAALSVLAEFPEGLIALDLLRKINEQFGLNIVRSSLSPQLTRLKNDGKIINSGSLWLLTRSPDLFLDTDKNTK